MNRLTLPLGLAVVVGASVVTLAIAGPAAASSHPSVTALSKHSAVYWGGTSVTVHGRNFTGVRQVLLGKTAVWGFRVISSSTLTLTTPDHGYGLVHLHVVTSSGASPVATANEFRFVRPTMNTPIQGGLTARQEQTISARVRRQHKNVHTARRTKTWSAAMGQTAAKRAQSWLGLPYSWAGGNAKGPTAGVCAHNGGDLDCHIVGFDCSGLALYAWAPYKTLAHSAATQHGQAGRFHPAIGELMPGDLVFFSGYIAGGIGHVAIYTGAGMVVQAAESGTRVMRSRLTDVIAANGVYRGATRPLSTGRQGAVPRISSMTSQLSLKGGYLTIKGSQLSGTTSISVGGQRYYSFTSRTASRLVVKAPAHAAGRASVVVDNAWGSAQRTLTYVSAPHLSALSPAKGPATGGSKITISGTALAPATGVRVGSTAVRFQLSGTRLTLTMPAHAPGAVTVTVYSRFGTSNQLTYLYLAPPSAAARPGPSTSAAPSTTAPTTAPSR